MVCAGRHRTTHSSIGCNGMAAKLTPLPALYHASIDRALAEMQAKLNTDPTKQAELDQRYKDLHDKETALKVAIRLDRANKS